MKKIIILLFGLLLWNYQSVFAQCDPKGISTDPRNPINNELPAKTNTFWDWEEETYNTYLVPSLTGSSYSPFTLNNNNVSDEVNAIILAEDFKPEDGWELIAWDMGYDEMGIPTINAKVFAFFALYNKHRGILRTFVSGIPSNQNYNSVMIRMKLAGVPNNAKPSMLQDPNGFTGLKTHWDKQVMESASDFISAQEGNWVYADFYINYDPCVCLNESELVFEIDFIDEADVALFSRLDAYLLPPGGTLPSQVTNNFGTSNSNYTINYKDLTNAAKVGQKAYKKYEEFNKFKKEQERIIGAIDEYAQPYPNLTKEQEEIVNGLSTLQAQIYDSDFLKDGLKALPYVGSALQLVDLFVSTGGSEAKSPQPQVIQGSIETKGSIKTSHTGTVYRYATPGSKNSNQLNNRYPYYNEVLGVVNIMDVPELRLKKIEKEGEKKSYSGIFHDKLYELEKNKWYYYTGFYVRDQKEIDIYNQFELDGKIDYFINPASGLDVNDVEVMGLIEYEVTVPSKTKIEEPAKFYYPTQYTCDRKAKVWQTDLLPIECLLSSSFESSIFSFYQYDMLIKNRSGSTIYQGSYPRPYDDCYEFEARLKLFFNLKRTSDGKRFLHVVSYPLNKISDPKIPTKAQVPFLKDIHLENTVLTQDIFARNVTIGPNVTTPSGQPIRINAVASINVLPNVTLNPEILLNIDQGIWCNASPIPPLDKESLVAYCKTADYSDPRRLRRKLGKHDPNKISFIDRSEQFEVTMFPNPIKDQLTIDLRGIDEEVVFEMKILDLNGRTVISDFVSASDNVKNLNVLSPGMYHIVLTNSTIGYNKSFKLIKQE